MELTAVDQEKWLRRPWLMFADVRVSALQAYQKHNAKVPAQDFCTYEQKDLIICVKNVNMFKSL